MSNASMKLPSSSRLEVDPSITLLKSEIGRGGGSASVGEI
jgi:hypothetical protein